MLLPWGTVNLDILSSKAGTCKFCKQDQLETAPLKLKDSNGKLILAERLLLKIKLCDGLCYFAIHIPTNHDPTTHGSSINY